LPATLTNSMLNAIRPRAPLASPGFVGGLLNSPTGFSPAGPSNLSPLAVPNLLAGRENPWAKSPAVTAPAVSQPAVATQGTAGGAVEQGPARVSEFTADSGPGKYLKSGWAKFDDGDYSAAARIFYRGCRLFGDDARLHMARAHALIASGDLDSGGVAVMRVVELEPQLLLDVAKIVGKHGRADEIRLAMANAEARCRTDPSLPAQMVMVYVNLARSDKTGARTVLQGLLKRMAQNHRHRDALEALWKALGGSPQDIPPGPPVPASAAPARSGG